MPTPLDEDYPVVLHSGERLLIPEVGHAWRTKFAAIRQYLNTGQAADVFWITSEVAADIKGLYQAVQQNTDKPFVGFLFVPNGEICPATLVKDPIIAAIARGTPFLIWVDQAPAIGLLRDV